MRRVHHGFVGVLQQGIVQGTYEKFAGMGRQHFGGDTSGKWILTSGLGGMGGGRQAFPGVVATGSCNAQAPSIDLTDHFFRYPVMLFPGKCSGFTGSSTWYNSGNTLNDY